MIFPLLLVLGCAASSTSQDEVYDVRAERLKAAHAERRVIMNNDGNDCLGDREGEPHTAEALLARRSTPLVGSQVDAVFYCTGIFNSYTHRSEETELRRVRKMTDEVGTERRRPLLVAARVPDSVRFARAIGLDLERWLEEDLVDLLVGGGYLHLEPWKSWAALGEKHDVRT